MKRFYIKHHKFIGFSVSDILPFVLLYVLLFFAIDNITIDIPAISIEGILILIGLFTLMFLIVAICRIIGEKIQNFSW